MTTTHTDPTGAALLRAILLRPDDDTARLVFADWLDEHGEHERAEFIRVQCELARKRDSEPPPAPTRELAEFVRDLMRLEARERELLTDARRAEWSGIPCPVCEGATVAEHTADGWSSLEQCDRCTGTGFAPVTVRRGFVESVRCRMGDVLREQYEGHAAGLPVDPDDRFNSREWTLTPWAADVLASHPVTRWEIVDREPWASFASSQWGWWSENTPYPPDASTLPHVVMGELAHDPRRCDANISLRYTAETRPPGGCILFPTEAEARDALACAVGRVARRLAGLPEVTP